MAEPDFQSLQREFAACIRDPSRPIPDGIEPRRMAIYRDLFYNNIANFIRNSFPVLHKVLAEQRWHDLVRAFMQRHSAASPYFLEIPAEFLRFLEQHPEVWSDLPGFVLELAHYEYMELVLRSSREAIPESGFKADGDLLAAAPVVSPVTCLLSYQWPVHRISPDNQPEAPESAPIWLMVYRNREDKVQFMELNAATARLLQLLEEQPLWSGERVLTRLAEELGAEPGVVMEFGATALKDLHQRDVLLGTRLADVGELDA